MKKKDLFIYYSNSMMGSSRTGEVITFESLVRLAKSRAFIKSIKKYKNVYFYCPSFTGFARPFLTAVICRLLGSKTCYWVDKENNHLRIGIKELCRQFSVFFKEQLTYKTYLRTVKEELADLLKEEHCETQKSFEGIPCYLRCDMSYGYIAGGSIGHIAGVVNNLEQITGNSPLFISSDTIPTVDHAIIQHIIKGEVSFGNIRDISSIAYNEICYDALESFIGNKKIMFLYQRSALNAYAGIKYALKNQIPFVLEYNGSEVWISGKWGGRKLKANEISEQIERLTFDKADLITCVSRALQEQLVQNGVSESKIIVNPNGVDPNKYRPELSGKAVRKIFNIDQDKIVVGFIGTYGAWHGAEILAQAFANTVSSREYGEKLHFMFIGDGQRMPDVKRIISSSGFQEKCSFTGVVPQNEGPDYLAACDILVSPQIKNPDGTPFFGSPTKLFEYMAMGKAIIASNMEQLAEVCENGKTALLCEPGSVSELSDAILRLASDKALRDRLGANARKEVCEKYTWEIHTKKIVEALQRKMEAPNV